MSANRIPWSAPSFPQAQAAGGTASFGDIIGGSFEQMRLVDNSTSAQEALTEGYEEWRRRYKAGTGQEPPPNPLIPRLERLPAAQRAAGQVTAMDEARIVEQQKLEFAQTINATASTLPVEAVRDWAQFDPAQFAEQSARTADANLANLMESRPGWDKYIAAFAGAGAGSMRDPITLGSMFVGGGAGGARTAIGRIFTTAASEAAVNGISDAIIEPSVQSWRAQAGLEHGWDQAIANVAFAAGLGGFIGAGGRGIGEVVDFARLTPEQRAAMKPDLRGAIDAADQLALVQSQRPEGLSANRHEVLASRAEILAQRLELPEQLIDDDVQVNRIVEQLAPRPESVTRAGAPVLPRTADEFSATLDDIRLGAPDRVGPSSKPVSRFVRAMGGIDPASPLAEELRARGVTSQSLPGLYNRTGIRTATAQGVQIKRAKGALDNVPIDEARAEFPDMDVPDDGNGYVDQQFFVDAIEAEQGRAGGPSANDDQRIYYERNGVDFQNMNDGQILDRMAAIDGAEQRYAAATADAPDGLTTDEAILLPPGFTRRAYTDQAVRQAIKLAGPGVGDDVIRKAVDLHLVERENLADAVDWAMSDAAGVRRTLPAPSLEELGSTPPAPAGLDDPGHIEPIDDLAAELDELGDDFMVPYGDGAMSIGAMKADLKAAAWLERVVEACKI